MRANNSQMRAVILATALLMSGQVALAAVCGTATTPNIVSTGTAVFTCTCPVGTGLITPITTGTTVSSGLTLGTAAAIKLTSSNTAGITTITLTDSAGTAATTGTAAQTAAFCDDLMPGYKMANAVYDASTPIPLPTACSTAGSFCPGVPLLFGGANVANSGVSYSSATAANLVLATSTTFAAITSTNTLTIATTGSAGVTSLACDSGGVTMVSNSAFTACQSAAGYYLAGSSVATTTNAATSGTACTGASQTPVRGFICATGTYGTALSVASLANEVVCQANSVSNDAGTSCVAAAGYYGANDAIVTVTYTACPTGTTTASGTTIGATTVAGCTDLKAG